MIATYGVPHETQINISWISNMNVHVHQLLQIIISYVHRPQIDYLKE